MRVYWSPGAKVDASDWHDMTATQVAVDGFASDFDAMRAADACVLVLPAGPSAHLEAGWFTGAGRPLVVLMLDPCEPDLMYRLGGPCVEGSMSNMLSALAAIAEGEL